MPRERRSLATRATLADSRVSGNSSLADRDLDNCGDCGESHRVSRAKFEREKEKKRHDEENIFLSARSLVRLFVFLFVLVIVILASICHSSIGRVFPPCGRETAARAFAPALACGVRTNIVRGCVRDDDGDGDDGPRFPGVRADLSFDKR